MRGIIDTLVGAELLRASRIPHRNRLAVILIDSGFETACRAFLQHKAKIRLSDAHKHRDNLIAAMKSKLPTIDPDVWDNINFYYDEIRCDFYHESAGKTITDTALLDYRDTVEFVVDQAFGEDIRRIVESALQDVTAAKPTIDEKADFGIHVTEIDGRVEKVVVAVARVHPERVEELNDFFKREGDSLRLRHPEFTNMLARNDGSKKLFYFDREKKRWTLSALGKFRLNQLREGR
jgi:hypothetical protein